MVPIEQVFDNMCIGHGTGLYNSSQFPKWRFAVEREGHKNRVITGDDSEIDLNCIFKPSLGLESKMHHINIPLEDGANPSSPQEAKPESGEHPDDSPYGNEGKSQDPGIGGSLPVKVILHPTKFHRVMVIFALGLSIFLVRSLSRAESLVANELVRPSTLSLRQFHTLQIVSTPSMMWAGTTARTYFLGIFIRDVVKAHHS
jgi:hypothetical protein